MSKKKTTQIYISELIQKGITIMPLTDYITAQINIYHQCECTHIWKPKPCNILYGYGCPICAVKSHPMNTPQKHSEYMDRLKKNNIQVTPLEEYKGVNNKILHKCVCNVEWEVIPKTVLNGSLCKDCGIEKAIKTKLEKEDLKYEIYKGIPTYLYFIRVGKFYKIGVAMKKNKNVQQVIRKRYLGEMKKGIGIFLLSHKEYEDGYDACLMEQKILLDNFSIRYKGDKILEGGDREIITERIDFNSYLV